MKILDKSNPRKVEQVLPVPVQTPPMKVASDNWEYHQVKLPVANDGSAIGELGRQGWELVSVVAMPHDPSKATFFFKRRR